MYEAGSPLTHQPRKLKAGDFDVWDNNLVSVFSKLTKVLFQYSLTLVSYVEFLSDVISQFSLRG
jgi:hypothetical protein